MALSAVALVGLAALLGLLLGGRDGALTGATVGLGACVLLFTVSSTLWALDAGRRFRHSGRRPR